MAEYWRLSRLYLVLLAIVTVGRWVLSLQHVPYEKATDKLSIVILTLFASIFYAAFCRRWLGFGIGRCAVLGVLFAVASQLVILLSTVASYAFGIDSYFNYPLALSRPVELGSAPVSLGLAVGIRLGGAVVNVLTSAIAGAIGWGLGSLLPRRTP
jgi:hypothetical protein